MKIEVGDIIYAHNKRLLVVHDPFESETNEYPFLLIDLDKFEVNNGWSTLDSMGKSFKIDRVLNTYEVVLAK
ncbi:hypothetical protein [Paenibacillus naphthalenovorans]|uniref:Uncharacterized protein n=1 Tax=Paenibacillus naphthalenovorans TaxID=162209 RepID=A0A0U2MWF9_9BACL|nr:hypothetical protein [Paenibacillus naphthalenovorans]ALS22223.1 hypothetical protein IJ22_18490 [Paenibacillus naphthalenovorans]